MKFHGRGRPHDRFNRGQAMRRRCGSRGLRAGEREFRNPERETVTITRKAPAGAPSSGVEPDAAGKIAAYDTAQKIVEAVKKAGKARVA